MEKYMLTRIFKQNKYKFILINSIVWGIAVLAFKWFSNEIISHLFVTAVILIFPLFVWVVLIFILTVNSIRKQPKRFKTYIPLLILSTASIVFLFVSFEIPKVRLEYTLYKNTRENIVADIRSGNLTDNHGHVSLSGFSKLVSVRGEAFVFEYSDERIVIGFYFFRNMLSAPSSMIIFSSDNHFDDIVINPRYHSQYPLDYIELDENWRYYFIRKET
jgi:hypothetical protein